MMSELLPRVTFTQAEDARDAYFALAEMARSAGDDLNRAARDDSVTVAQMNAVAEKHLRLNGLANSVFNEWQRLSEAPAPVSQV